MSLVTPPRELQFSPDDSPSDVCDRVAQFALREAEALERRRFFAHVAIALGRAVPREGGQEAGSELARELASHMREPWVREGIDRGLRLYGRCVDETGRRCVAGLVAEYLAWREPPDPFFHRIGPVLARHDATELIKLARVVSGYARTPKPSGDEQRLLAAVPCRERAPELRPRLAVLAFAGQPQVERLRSTTQILSLGSERILAAMIHGALGVRAEPGPPEVPLVGRPLLWFPRAADHDLRRLHLLFASAIV